MEETNDSQYEKATEGQILYIGNLTNRVYNEINCVLIEGIEADNMVMFRSAYEAETAGYTFYDLCQSKERTSEQNQ